MRVVDAYTIAPHKIQSGDVMLLVVKAVVDAQGQYRIYRCPYEGDDIPQGSRVFADEAVARQLFPALLWAPSLEAADNA